jgi:predicted nucleic acid-binding protein
LSRYIPLLIAAHAYATGATIVTANTDEFKPN